eukprot:gb/GEZN01016118.1/.p1 GENE.gb/GEZN01016118.1/~~gb/GEZN01016118.1/.p1  ORF type:complete len:249 (-),score=34.52 gb/GEZN01016118.1/:69-815(-)
MENLHLDPAIRNWVLLPIFIVMASQGIARANLAKIITTAPKVSVDKLQKTQLLQRSRRLRANAQFIPPSALRMRKAFFVKKAFRPKTEDEEPEVVPAQPADPLAFVGMAKNYMMMMVPNMLMMGWVSYFFAGFVLVKLPFSLTDSFKAMTQRGINMSSLDVSYVSSLSWYFLNVFGLRGLFQTSGAGEVAMDEAQMMQQQMQMGGAMTPGPDPSAGFESERTELEIFHHEHVIPYAGERIVSILKLCK